MEKIPSAEELYRNSKTNPGLSLFSDDVPCLIKLMQDFAKLHVERALKIASLNAMIKVVNNEEFREIEEGDDLVEYYECGSDTLSVSVDSILNAYPLTLIK
jgi:hypothetical protein